MVSVMLSQPHPKQKRKKERNSDYDCSNWVVLQLYAINEKGNFISIDSR